MALLLSSSQMSGFKRILSDHFDTFSSGINRQIVVWKEPTKQIVGNPDSYGYDEQSISESNITYTPNSGVYYAMVIYDKLNQVNTISEISQSTSNKEIKIKVREEAKNFITNGKTERVDVDGYSFNEIEEEFLQNFLGDKYYYFKLKKTK